MNTSKDTSALTGLPGSVMIGVPSDNRPAPCGMPGLHGDLDELDRPTAEGVLDHLVGAGAHAAGGDDQVGLPGMPVEHRAELRRRRRSTSAWPTTSPPASRTAAASMTALDS